MTKFFIYLFFSIICLGIMFSLMSPSSPATIPKPNKTIIFVKRIDVKQLGDSIVLYGVYCDGRFFIVSEVATVEVYQYIERCGK